MIESLNQLDTELFLFLNGLHCPMGDVAMWWITKGLVWIPLYLLFLFALLRKTGKKIWIVLLAVGLLVTLADQSSVRLFKNPVQRLRPSHEPTLQGKVHIVNGYKGGKFGFISSHAANTFGIALLLLLFVRKRWFTFSILTWAFLMSYSRIYLGVHYPGDVLVGALWGMLLALLVYIPARKALHFQTSTGS